MAETSTVRFDGPTREAIFQYMASHRMSFSQAVRTLVALALRGEESADATFRAASFREGVRAGAAALSARIQDAIQGALSEAERF